MLSTLLRTFPNRAVAAFTTLFSSCTLARNWQSNDMGQEKAAQFSELSGRQKLDIRLDTGVTYLITYSAAAHSGKLHLVLEAANQRLVDRDIVGALRDTLIVPRNPHSRYRLIVTGTKAAGSYTVRYWKSRDR